MKSTRTCQEVTFHTPSMNEITLTFKICHIKLSRAKKRTSRPVTGDSQVKSSFLNVGDYTKIWFCTLRKFFFKVSCSCIFVQKNMFKYLNSFSKTKLYKVHQRNGIYAK